MTSHRDISGVMTLVVVSMASILPVVVDGAELPVMELTNVAIQFSGSTLQSLYDCLCEDNMFACYMHYTDFLVVDITRQLKSEVSSPIPNKVTARCNPPSAFGGGQRRYYCQLEPGHDTSICACVPNCPVSHINETHSTVCRGKCVNIMWNTCHIDYEDFGDKEPPFSNSCPLLTPTISPPSVATETDENLGTTDANPVTTNKNYVTTNKTPTTTHTNYVSTNENSVPTTENYIAPDKIRTTKGTNSVTTYENPHLTTENPLTTNKRPLKTDRNSETTDGNPGITDTNQEMTNGNPVTTDGNPHTDINPPTTEVVELDSESTNNVQALAIAVGVCGGILAISVISAVVAFFYWRSKKKKPTQGTDIEPEPANHQRENTDFSVLNGSPQISEHIYDEVSSLSGESEKDPENNIDANNEPSLHPEITESRTVENKPESAINPGQLVLYSEPVERRLAEDEYENGVDTGLSFLYLKPIERRSAEQEYESGIDTDQSSLYLKPIERSVGQEYE
ncbi:hypothetical protein PoB_004291300, partial [Plakobranchus ocellatus]